MHAKIKYEIANRMVKVKPSTIKRLNRLRIQEGKKLSNDEIIIDALDFKKKYRKVVE